MSDSRIRRSSSTMKTMWSCAIVTMVHPARSRRIHPSHEAGRLERCCSQRTRWPRAQRRSSVSAFIFRYRSRRRVGPTVSVAQSDAKP